jgi:hypothetical protein
LPERKKNDINLSRVTDETQSLMMLRIILNLSTEKANPWAPLDIPAFAFYFHFVEWNSVAFTQKKS